MPIPDAKRVLYSRNPIAEVVCQLRFPAILKIELEPPVDFQERIRDGYPHYQSKSTLAFSGLPGPLNDLIAKEMPLAGRGVAHEFRSRDENWTLSITREFLGLQCNNYQRWEEFKERINAAITAFVPIYSPSFMTRIGLRYRDLIRRSQLGLSNVAWDQLLQPWIGGPLGSTVATEVLHTASQTVMQLADNRSRALLQNGIVEGENKEQCYIIDLDLFDENQTETQDAPQRLDFLNSQARLLFHWCIQERLHVAMEPGAI